MIGFPYLDRTVPKGCDQPRSAVRDLDRKGRHYAARGAAAQGDLEALVVAALFTSRHGPIHASRHLRLDRRELASGVEGYATPPFVLGLAA
jgi:hypothetical protein